MKIPSKIYNKLKWILMILVPALITYITTLGDIWHFDPIIVIRTIAATATFVGALVGVSCYNYNKPIPMDITGLKYIEDDEIKGVEADE